MTAEPSGPPLSRQVQASNGAAWGRAGRLAGWLAARLRVFSSVAEPSNLTGESTRLIPAQILSPHDHFSLGHPNVSLIRLAVCAFLCLLPARRFLASCLRSPSLVSAAFKDTPISLTHLEKRSDTVKTLISRAKCDKL